MDIDLNEWLGVGEITKPHGVKGLVKVRVFNEKSSLFEESKLDVLVTSKGRSLPSKLEIAGRIQGFLIGKLSSVSNRNDAESLRQALISVKRVDIEIDDDEILHADLIGCSVTQRGVQLGIVEQVVNNGASDILVIVDGETQEMMVPFVDDWVEAVDIDKKSITLDPAGEWQVFKRRGK